MAALTKLSNAVKSTCMTSLGRDSVEGPYYFYSGRNMYDIRRPADDPIISQDFVGFLSLASTRTALGIDIIPELTITTEAFEYAAQSDDVYTAFTRAGDYLYPVFLTDLEYLLDHGVRVILMHGDADYIANWLGGEAVSLTLNHSQASLFQATPYAPLVFGNVSTDDDYGKVREQGNLSFVVVRDAGHFVPFSQPALTLELFRRAMAGLDLTTGRGPINSSAAFPFVPDSPLTT
ncbi:hypothetical protein SBRCBS47491_008194 [Sporothrix bragantina]|uniref:Uncharacterized protein n=1 Tax=Sporothrix bragantina TaxID=671064 RepID=A0ABP0CJE7_9PEZI